MAQPLPQTGTSFPPGAKVQPPQPVGQAPGGDATVSSPRRQEVGATPEGRANSDWGLAPKPAGLSRESKFILVILFVLVSVISYVVFDRWNRKPGTEGDVAATEGTDGDPVVDPTADPVDVPTTRPRTTPRTAVIADNSGNATDPFAGDQEEPGYDPNAVVEMDPTLDNGFEAGGANEFEPAGEPAEFVDQSEPGAVAGFDPTLADPTLVDAGMEDPTFADPTLEGMPEELPTDVPVDNEFETGPAGVTVLTNGTKPRAVAQNTSTRTNPLNVTDGSVDPTMGQFGVEVTPRTGTRATTPRTTVPRTGGRTAPRAPTGTRNPVPTPTNPEFSVEEKYGDFRAAQPGEPRLPEHRRPIMSTVSMTGPVTAEYIVQPHDNFWRISRKAYGSARYFKALQQLNAAVAPNPSDMQPGLRISTPPREYLEQNFAALISQPSRYAPTAPRGMIIADGIPFGLFIDQQSGEVFYRVGNDESLTSISQKTLGRSSRWDEIYGMNRDQLPNPNELSVGTILRLPADAVQPRLVGNPATTR